ncbi:MAG TPA: nodulation protein NfeD [Anaerolineales bacterium]|nr:nodulation protein NfeD [Anaerolineales bacterium]
MRKYNLCLLVLLITGLLLGLAQPAQAQTNAPMIVVLTADGPVTPAMAQYLRRGIKIAERQGAQALIFQLNTPGGSIDTMNQMEQDILASPVPVIVYVAPRGAMAASAGTIITLSGHASAMAPETMIGAASPVGSQGENLPSTEELKTKNAMAATARSLTERRGTAAQNLAQDTILTAVAASSSEAKQAGLIDFIATDLNDLRSQLDGFTVTVNSQPVILHTANATFETINISFIEQLLLIVTDPNIVFLLITIGVQAIIIEISSPGGWVAGFIGVIFLGLATYGLGILPVNWFGLLFIVTSFVLFILDIKAPTHGGLTTAGVGSLIVGALVLFNTPVTPSFQHVSVPLVVGVSLVSGAIFFGIMMIAVRAQKTPVRTGEESLAGRMGVARTMLNPKGSVQLGGELWSAELEQGATKLPAGTRVEVVKVDGLRLVVRKVE